MHNRLKFNMCCFYFFTVCTLFSEIHLEIKILEDRCGCGSSCEASLKFVNNTQPSVGSLVYLLLTLEVLFQLGAFYTQSPLRIYYHSSP
jgi:hypothetical protein